MESIILNRLKVFLLFLIVTMLSACGSSSDDSNTTSEQPATIETKKIVVKPVKGPLVNAVVKVYKINPDGEDGSLKGEEIASGRTDDNAKISDLALPFPLEPPYMIEVTADENTTDLSTGQPPVIDTMKSMLTADALNSGKQVYPTPLTTLAVGILENTAKGDVTDEKIKNAADKVTSTLGFGMSSDVDIFTDPPVIDDSADTAEKQAQAVAYRVAVEATTAILYEASKQTKEDLAQADGTVNESVDDVNDALTLLAKDLSESDATSEAIDGEMDDVSVDENVLAKKIKDLLETSKPEDLIVPNTDEKVSDMGKMLKEEQEQIGSTVEATIEDTVENIEPAVLSPDEDGDGVFNNADAFPQDENESTDTDGDGVGNNADTDDDGDGTPDTEDTNPLDNTVSESPETNDPAETDADSTTTDDTTTPVTSQPTNPTTTIPTTPSIADADSDGQSDSQDNCPNKANANQADADSDGAGDVCDTDPDFAGAKITDISVLDSIRLNKFDGDKSGVDYAVFTITYDSATLNSREYQWNGESWFESTSSDNNKEVSLFSDGQWRLESDNLQVIASEDEWTIAEIDSEGNYSRRFYMNFHQQDVSGEVIKDALSGMDSRYIDKIDATATFASGSTLYKAAMRYPEMKLRLNCSGSTYDDLSCQTAGIVDGESNSGIESLDALFVENPEGTEHLLSVMNNNMQAVQLVGSSADSSGIAKAYQNNTTSIDMVGEGSWEKTTIFGTEMVLVSFPDDVKSQLSYSGDKMILAMFIDEVRVGRLYEATNEMMPDWYINDIAMQDALDAMSGLPTVLTKDMLSGKTLYSAAQCEGIIGFIKHEFSEDGSLVITPEPFETATPTTYGYEVGDGKLRYISWVDGDFSLAQTTDAYYELENWENKNLQAAFRLYFSQSSLEGLTANDVPTYCVNSSNNNNNGVGSTPIDLTGQIGFTYGDSSVDMPENPLIRITPEAYANEENNWSSVYCVIESDGGLGVCESASSDSGFINLFTSPSGTYRMIVINDANGDKRWSSGESRYCDSSDYQYDSSWSFDCDLSNSNVSIPIDLTGQVTFAEGAVSLEVPENVVMEITPQSYANDGKKWASVKCTIQSDGNLGECVAPMAGSDFTDLFTTPSGDYRVFIYDDSDGDQRFDEGERSCYNFSYQYDTSWSFNCDFSSSNNNNNGQTEVTWISGQVSFVDGAQQPVTPPANLSIRLTPASNENDDANWASLNCVLDSNGNFNSCHADNSDANMEMKFTSPSSSDLFGMIIYTDTNESNRFDVDEYRFCAMNDYDATNGWNITCIVYPDA